MKRLFIATTDTVENGKILDYYGVVSSHIVAGTGFFTDFAAGLSDLFGGRSWAYRGQLEHLYEEALDELSSKAQLLGANAVLGLKIDMDNISGKGMSMFMITAVGTAVKILSNTHKQEVEDPDQVANASLDNEINKRAILMYLDDKDYILPREYWETILRYPDNDYVLPLIRSYFSLIAKDGYGEALSENDFTNREVFYRNFPTFIEIADRDLVAQGMYEAIKSERGSGMAIDTINKYSLFDPKSILSLIRDGYTKRAIAVLGAKKLSYNQCDLKDMEALIEELDHLPNQGKIDVVKGGLLTKDEEKYICPSGHKNNPEVEYCNTCHENIKGLKLEQVKAIETFKNRVLVLKDLLSE